MQLAVLKWEDIKEVIRLKLSESMRDNVFGHMMLLGLGTLLFVNNLRFDS